MNHEARMTNDELLEKCASNGEFSIRETYATQERAVRADWDQPEMDDYNDYNTNVAKLRSAQRLAGGPQK